MSNLSSPLAELRPEYDVVVVGSGYGGSVVARRLAEAGQSVCVLERGLEITPGHFPATLGSAIRSFQIDSHRGRVGRRDALFDMRVNHDVSVLVGCGLGGTSLINANVMLAPKPLTAEWWPQDLLARWPAELKGEKILDRYFIEAKKRLGARRPPSDVSLSKVLCLVNAASGPKDADSAVEELNSVPVHNRAPIAVSFKTEFDDLGVQHGRCTLCGNCVTGCNYSAKNTLIMNYLPAAAAKGAAIFCGVRVNAVEPDGTNGWFVHTAIIDRGSRLFKNPELTIRANAVFLASGSLGSTEILLRSRDRFGLSMSSKLGEHFSGNGDVIAFGYNTTKRVDGFGYGVHLPPALNGPGPTIAGMLEERDPKDLRNRLLIQEGAIPGALGFAMRILGPVIARIGRTSRGVGSRFTLLPVWREIDSLVRGTHHGALLRTQTYLGMSFDDGRGRMKLLRDRLRIDWLGAGHEPIFRKMAARLATLTDAMGGRYVINPLWSRMFGRRLLTVHPLGGCAMADDPKAGVVNDRGQVYEVARDGGESKPYPGLYVCDGSIIPTPLGVNPALTISALAERIAEKYVENITELPPQKGPRRSDTGVAGIRYAEHLRGRMVLDGVETRVEFFLHLSREDIEKAIDNPPCDVGVIGTAYVRDVANGAQQQLTISQGTFSFAVDDPRVADGTLAIYRFKLTSSRGDVYWLLGQKTINSTTCKRSTWKSATRVPFFVFKNQDPPSGRVSDPLWNAVDRWDPETSPEELLATVPKFNPKPAGAGIVGGSMSDVVKLAAGVEIVNERRFWKRAWLNLRFQWLFLNGVIQARVWVLRRTTRFDAWNREVNTDPKCGEQFWDKRQPGHPRYLLTRCTPKEEWADSKPPVVLIPGFAMSTYWFRPPMPPGRTNITQFLLDRGYDVWLLDYRPSSRLAASLEQFTLDDVAMDDLPAAMEHLHKVLDGRQFQVLAHCVGSLTMFMALLKGRLRQCWIHSMILSQSFAFIDQPLVNRIKARLHLAEVLEFFGLRPFITTEFDQRSTFGSRVLDRLLYFYPSRERCRSGVCRRLLLVYGEANRHAELDHAAHLQLYDMVNRGNLRSIAHLQRMVARHRLVNSLGENVYVTETNRANVRIPLLLLQGAKNNLFRRSGAVTTSDWLKSDPLTAPHELIELPNSGHMDGYIGRNSAEVFETIDDYFKRKRSETSAGVQTSPQAVL